MNIAVWGVPNMGLAPAIAANGSSAASLGTTLAQSMNSALRNRFTSETGVQIFDMYSLVTAVNANPTAYGLINASDASGAIPGADPSQYLCWDGIHPTAAGINQILTAEYSEFDFTLSSGAVVHDYLQQSGVQSPEATTTGRK
ncbi:MAG: hypothetical protein CK530_12585 [Planctomycetaceae bacterium]|nr:MAG: hypothetical protein CK530_12585 [Planctomycetaceae bacterium]